MQVTAADAYLATPASTKEADDVLEVDSFITETGMHIYVQIHL